MGKAVAMGKPKPAEEIWWRSVTIDLDESEGAPVQLAAALRSNAARVIDLFRSWDTNEGGLVSHEFLAASIGPGGATRRHRLVV